MTKPAEVSDSTFEDEVLKNSQPVLVDFWAEWCQPCKMIAPLVEDLAGEYEGKVKFTKLDVDSNPKTAMRFNVRSIPTLLIFKGGQPVEQVIGAVPKSSIKKRLEAALARG
ncbi:MAG: thioredoxin [Chloroflexi bacterium]|nr:thioredoxin [Chloroflexota bacterium]